MRARKFTTNNFKQNIKTKIPIRPEHYLYILTLLRTKHKIGDTSNLNSFSRPAAKISSKRSLGTRPAG